MFTAMVVDVLSKYFAENNFFKFDTSLAAFTYIQNSGFAFGSLSESSELLRVVLYSILGIYTITLLIVTIYLLRNKRVGLLKLGLILFASGVLGNTIDKVFRGYVIDFIHIKTSFLNDYVFNFADIWLVSGALFIVLSLIIHFNRIFFDNEQRGRFLIDKRFQLNSVKLLLVGLITYAVSVEAFSYSLNQASGLSDKEFKIIFYGGSLFILTAHGLIFTFLTILFTHRSSGPLIAFRNHLKAIKNGSNEPLRMREADFNEILIECSEIVRDIKSTSNKE